MKNILKHLRGLGRQAIIMAGSLAVILSSAPAMAAGFTTRTHVDSISLYGYIPGGYLVLDTTVPIPAVNNGCPMDGGPIFHIPDADTPIGKNLLSQLQLALVENLLVTIYSASCSGNYNAVDGVYLHRQ